MRFSALYLGRDFSVNRAWNLRGRVRGLASIVRGAVGISAVMWVSLVLQALIWLASRVSIRGHMLIRKVQPAAWQEWIVGGFAAVAALLTTKHQGVFSATWPVSVVAVVIIGFAMLPPVVGLIQNRWCEQGEQIFERSRFRGHLSTNVLGGAAAAGFYWAGQSTPGFVAFTEQFADGPAFNVVLPISVAVIFALVRQQQIDRCPDLDQLVDDPDSDWKSKLRGDSLTDAHQLLNCLYLIAVLFLAASTIMYLLAFTLVQAKNGEPVGFSVQMGVAMLALMGFLFACGMPASWGNQTVYFSFLTGTPGALLAILAWLVLLAPSPARNWFAVSIVGVGYLLYCTAAVFGVLQGKQAAPAAATGAAPPASGPAPLTATVELHYFAGAILAAALTIMMGVLYLTS